MMLRDPNTLDLFERKIREICRRVHDAGGLLYMDGANMNALVGVALPGDMGVDVIHLNLHKTFSTPHGGGGPGCGPCVCTEELAPFLPVPRVEKVMAETRPARSVPDAAIQYRLNFNYPHSIGRVKAFYGNFGMMVRA